MLHYLLNFLYPPRCAACDVGMPIDATRRVCPSCLAAMEPPRPPLCLVCGAPLHIGDEDERCDHCRDTPPAFDSARAITRYRSGADGSGVDGSSAVASLLRRHKYGLDQSLGRALAEYLDAAPLLETDAHDVVNPVPLNSPHLRWRGFNQAALLGAALARWLNCPLDVATLARVRSTASQPHALAHSAHVTCATLSRSAVPRASSAAGCCWSTT